MELKQSNPLVNEFIERSGGKNGVITILPTASEIGEDVGKLYQDMFSELCDDVEFYLIEERRDAENTELLGRLRKTSGLFFTGGNQLKITSLLGGSEVMKFVKKAKDRNVFIAGTSAGASAMSDTMISWGPADSMLKGNLQMSPGIGLIQNMVIDSHFVKRGRMTRLLHLVSQNPGTLGVGLSEDTGILVDVNPENRRFEVIGARQVVIVDGRDVQHSNIASLKSSLPFSVTDVRVHVLGAKYGYDFTNHQVIVPETPEIIEDMEEPSEVSEIPFRPQSSDW